MIVITATVWPHGQSPESDHGRTIAASTPLGILTCIVVNNGEGSREHGVYDVYAARDPKDRSTWLRIGGFDNERHSEHRFEITQRALDLYRQWDEAGCPS